MLFGGVFDEEEDDRLKSTFYDDLYGLNMAPEVSGFFLVGRSMIRQFTQRAKGDDVTVEEVQVHYPNPPPQELFH